MSFRSEEQWEIVGYCVDCGAALYQMGAQYQWRPADCPYSGADHMLELELEILEVKDGNGNIC